MGLLGTVSCSFPFWDQLCLTLNPVLGFHLTTLQSLLWDILGVPKGLGLHAGKCQHSKPNSFSLSQKKGCKVVLGVNFWHLAKVLYIEGAEKQVSEGLTAC